MPMPTVSVGRCRSSGSAPECRFSRFSNAEPATVISMNEVTRPRTMSTGRRVTESLPLSSSRPSSALPAQVHARRRKSVGSMPAFASSEDVDEWAAPASPEEDAGVKYARGTEGRPWTGRMHGEMPVMKPRRLSKEHRFTLLGSG